MSNYFSEEYERAQVEQWTLWDINLQLKERDSRIEELEVEIERLSSLLFKYAKMFAEELNI